MTDKTTEGMERRWTIFKGPTVEGVEGPETGRATFIEVMPVADHEADVAKARREAEDWWGPTTDYWYERTQELEARCRSANDMSAYHETRADKAEADLATLQAQRDECERQFQEKVAEMATLQAERDEESVAADNYEDLLQGIEAKRDDYKQRWEEAARQAIKYKRAIEVFEDEAENRAEEAKTYDPARECRCGHTAHWHGQEIGDPQGSGECEFSAVCECKRFDPAPTEPQPTDTRQNAPSVPNQFPEPSTEAGEEARGHDDGHGTTYFEGPQPVSPEPTPRCGGNLVLTQRVNPGQIAPACPGCPDCEPTPEDPQNKLPITPHNEDSEAVEWEGVSWPQSIWLQADEDRPWQLWRSEPRLEPGFKCRRYVPAAVTPLLPGLGEEEQKRLKSIAYGLETGYFHERSPSVTEYATKAADLLRDLADRPVSGEAVEELTPAECRELFSPWLCHGIPPSEIHESHPAYTGAMKLGAAQPHPEDEDPGRPLAISAQPVSQDPLGELLDLAPHEITCRCDKAGVFEWAAHDLSCPRREVGEMLSDRLREGAQFVKPWGHKISISIYVAGQDQARAVRAAQHAAQAAAARCYAVEFVGASVEAVSERPSDQGEGAQDG